MSGHAGVLPFPAGGGRATAGVQGRLRVDNRQTDEAALVRRIQSGDEAAFRELVERFQNKVYSIIYGILRNHNDAEDIAQQVFTKIYFSISNFDFRSSLLTWIYKITVNECYDYLRKRRVRKLVYESDLGDEEGVSMERSEPDTAPLILSRERFAYLRPGELAGSVGRGTFRKAPIWNWNASIARQFRLPNEWLLQWRAEAYNLSNTPQFDEPQRNLSSPAFGKITNTLNDGRVFQFGFRFAF